MPADPGPSRKSPDAEETVRATIERHGMIRPGDRVLAAVSGGGDSVLMLHLLIRHRARTPFTIQVAHLDHALRGAESDTDEAFVRDLAARYALPVTVERADLTRGPGDSSSVEERARDARRAFLRRVASSEGCSRIALGHTLDDQAETVLMWLLRGAGRGGLSGMEAVTLDGVIRPLIELRRVEVRRHLRTMGEAFRDDATNDDLTRLRNRIRHRLVPAIEVDFPGAVRTMGAEAEILSAEESWMEEAARALLEESGGRLAVSIAASAPIPLLRRAIRAAAAAAGVNPRSLGRDHIEAIRGLMGPLMGGKRVDLPAGWSAARRQDMVIFERTEEGAG